MQFRNQQTIFNGNVYDSKAEAIFAKQLETRKRGKDIKRWERQFEIQFKQNGKLLCSHFVDFMVVYPDGERELAEIKGRETDIWKLKRRMMFNAFGIGDNRIRYGGKIYRYTLIKADRDFYR